MDQIGKKNVGFQKNFGPKQIFCLNVFYGPRNLAYKRRWVQKGILGSKNFGSKKLFPYKILIEKKLGPMKLRLQKKFGFNKTFGSK